MFNHTFRNIAMALCLAAGITASAGVFSPVAQTAKNPDFPYLMKAGNVCLPKAVGSDGSMLPDLENTGKYYTTSNTVGSVMTPAGEEWYYTLNLEGTRLNPGNPYFVDMDFTGFTVKVYNTAMELVGQAKGNIEYPEGALKCRSVEVCMQLSTTFFNSNSSDYEVMLTFSFNPDKDANGNPRYGAKETTQAYTLTKDIPAAGSKLLFKTTGYPTTAINTSSSAAESFIMAFIEDTSWDGEDVMHSHFVIYERAGYNTPASEVKRFTVNKLYTMADGNNDSMPFSIVKKGTDIYVATAVYEKTFLVDPTAAEPVQNPDNNYVITLYKAVGGDFVQQSVTKIKVETAPEGYYYRSYALGNFMASDDVTFEFGDGTAPCYIITVVDATNTDETLGHYRVYNTAGELVKTFGEESDGFIQFDAVGRLNLQFGFYMPDGEENYGIVICDFPSMQPTGFIPTLFEYDAEAWNLVSVPARMETSEGIRYVASVLPSGESGDGANHYVAWFKQDGTVDHVDSLFLGENVGKVLTYIHHSVLSPYLFNTDRKNEYLCWIYRFINGTSKTSLELAVVDNKGNILASRMLPDGHSYENAYVSNTSTTPFIVINYTLSTSADDCNKMEFVRLPLNDFEGDGTEASPYIIKTYGDLNRVRFNLTSHFRIDNSINCAGQIFRPVTGEFTGSIDGGNYDISNLYIESSANNAAMFSNFGHKAMYGEEPVTASLKNVNFVNPTVVCTGQTIGSRTSGIVAAVMNNAELHNVNLVNPSMKTEASMSFGAIAGYGDKVSYTNSYIVNADFNLTSSRFLGAAFGELCNGKVSTVTVTGNINGRWNVGGLIGCNNVGTLEVSDVHVNAKIKGVSYVGGIAGTWNREVIKRVFVEGTLSGDDYVGGIAGSIGIADDDRKELEGEDYRVISNTLVGLESFTVPTTAEFAHRIFGYSQIDLGDHLVWVPDPTNPDVGEYIEVEASEEPNVSGNYVVTDIAAVSSATPLPVSEGVANTTGISDTEWLSGLGFRLAQWASEASEAKPWMLGAANTPVLYFEETAGSAMHIVDAELTGNVGETVVATLIAENVNFDNLAYESSNPLVAELADLTPGDDGEVKVHIQLNAPGQADIILSYGPVRRAVVHVTAIAATTHISFRSATAKGAENSQLDLALDINNIELTDITASSSDEQTVGINTIKAGKNNLEAIVTVDLKKVGTAEITATAKNITTKAVVTVSGTTGVDNVKVSVLTYDGLAVHATGCAIEIFDIQGRNVAAGTDTVSVADLATGIYIVRATDAEGATATMKISK